MFSNFTSILSFSCISSAQQPRNEEEDELRLQSSGLFLKGDFSTDILLQSIAICLIKYKYKLLYSVPHQEICSIIRR